jgi:predicted transcriptional regulator YheO
MERMTTDSSPTVVDRSRVLRAEFGPYLSLMDFLAELLGPRTEIVLHDTSDLSRSIVALTNGHVSGRSVGGPATDLVLKVLQNHEHDDRDYLANYLAESRTGGTFRSSTFFIRDAGGDVVGMLCLNIDDEPLTRARDLLSAITATTGLVKGAGRGADRTGPTAAPVAERLSTNVDQLALDGVARIVAAQGVEPYRMTPEEKVAAVRELERAGVFLLKGAVAQVAEALLVSEPTVYRYVKQVRRGDQSELVESP